MTIECIKSANTLKSLTAAGNDAHETVKSCTDSAQQAYGAYSPWFEKKKRRTCFLCPPISPNL